MCAKHGGNKTRAPVAFGLGGGAALKLSGVQLGSLMRFQGEVKVKGRNKEELCKIELEKVKMEREGREMEGVLDSRLNRFSPSNFAGLAHFLSGSFIEEKPVGVSARINREKEQSPVFPLPSLSLTLSLSPSPPSRFLHLLNPLIERLPQQLT